MDNIIAVVPMYKTGKDFPGYVLDPFTDRDAVGSCVVVDLLCSRDDLDPIALQSIVDEAAALGPDAVAHRLMGLAEEALVSIRASEVDELRGRPLAVEALMAVCDSLADLGVTVVALLPWWPVPDESPELFEVVLRDYLVQAIGVGHCADPMEVPYVADVASAIDRASVGRAKFIVTGPPPDGARGWSTTVLGDSDRTLVIEPSEAFRREHVRERVREAFDLVSSTGGSSPVEWSEADLLTAQFQPHGDAAARLAEAMATHHLVQPYVPEEMGPRLRDWMHPELVANYAFATHPVDPLATYLFREPIDEIIEGNWRPRVEVSASGHGINSYAHSYILVLPGLAVVAQVGFGGLYDEGQTEESWRDVMDNVNRLLDVYEVHQPLRTDQMIFAASSDIRGIKCAGLLKWTDSPPQRRRSVTDNPIPFARAADIIQSLYAAKA